MSLLGSGEFAELSWLPPRALRLYDELGLLPPARVDPGSGYCWCTPAQIRVILALDAGPQPGGSLPAGPRLRPVTLAAGTWPATCSTA